LGRTRSRSVKRFVPMSDRGEPHQCRQTIGKKRAVSENPKSNSADQGGGPWGKEGVSFLQKSKGSLEGVQVPVTNRVGLASRIRAPHGRGEKIITKKTRSGANRERGRVPHERIVRKKKASPIVPKTRPVGGEGSPKTCPEEQVAPWETKKRKGGDEVQQRQKERKRLPDPRRPGATRRPGGN